MALNAPSVAVTDDQIDMVASITGFVDRAVLTNALKSHRGDVGSVVNEYFDNDVQFRRKYGWDESVFSAPRDGDDSLGANNNNNSFSIHAPTVLYGTDPNSFYGAPSRPPSRVNNRSPLNRLADLATAEYTSDTPTSRQEEEDQLQRAINASLGDSGMQTPLAFPPPPSMPPPPQQSGITTSGVESGVQFGPANRPEYEPDEWAMVRLANRDPDADPALRTRKPGVPVLLRCRIDLDWNKHRLGALLMIYHGIPAARNALLRTGEPPGYGYGNKSDWWQGQAITVPAQDPRELVGDRVRVSWSDELHRLVAFLEGTDRAYGTADLLARAGYPEDHILEDPEKEFFYNFAMSHQPPNGDPDILATFMSSVEIGALEDLAVQATDSFGILDLHIRDEAEFEVQTLYHALDWMFFTEFKLAKEDRTTARTAWMSQASDVFTCRLRGVKKLPHAVDIPETLYLDRYLKKNHREIRELQLDMVEAMKAADAVTQKEEDLLRWVNPQTGKVYDDRRILINAALKRCREGIQRIQRRAAWRAHNEAGDKAANEFFLAEVVEDPPLLPDEAKVVDHYEAKIRELERQAAQIQQVLDAHITPQKENIAALRKAMAALLTDPEAAKEKLRPTYKYTLRGVVDKENVVYQRLRIPQTDAAPADGTAAPVEEKWWKIWLRPDDNTVEHEIVPFETVKKETCDAGCEPILIYASEKAMEPEPLPLSDALKNFVRFDNRLFKQELLESGRTAAHKRSAGLGLGDASQSKRLQRSASIDSMATNRASLGAGSDDEMRDAPALIDNDSAFGGSDTAFADDAIPDLIDHRPDLPPRPSSSSQLPSYEKAMEMESGVSPALAHVTLQDVKKSGASGGGGAGSPPPAMEMQERPNTNMPFQSYPPGILLGPGRGSAVNDDLPTEPPPLIDLDDIPKAGGSQAQAQAEAKTNGI
ncbi:hypothetical protein VTJ83DRAFT_1898 [Remersonia thermophila]|uniref:Ubiquitin interaction domain-containing protein n=1 Tax=Remersonia thermophila TaxID=72144 RepID=A0ABR4DJG4_9PEZI